MLSTLKFWFTCKELRFTSLNGNRFELMPVKPPGFDFPLYLRRGTSDGYNFRQIFFKHKEFSFLKFEPKTIIDLGGYVGLASAYFANAYPDAKIVLIEPDSDNFLIAQLNTRQFRNVRCINVGVWSESCFISDASERSDKDWSKRYIKVDTVWGQKQKLEHGIKALTIPKIMELAGFDSIDFIKIDIEGGEKALFLSPTAAEWIDKCKLITCELHEYYAPGCTEALHSAMKGKGFEYGKKIHGKGGALHIYARNEVAAQIRWPKAH